MGGRRLAAVLCKTMFGLGKVPIDFSILWFMAEKNSGSLAGSITSSWMEVGWDVISAC